MNALDETCVTWDATSLATGRYDGMPTTTTAAELVARVDALLARGSGYFEVSMQDQDYPVLSIAFGGGHSVVHCWWDAEHMSLLAGDESVASDAVIEMLVAEDEYPARFTGQFVSAENRAMPLLERFLHDGDAESLGDWYNL